MISLETAKRLKEAGFQQEPRNGDWVYWTYTNEYKRQIEKYGCFMNGKVFFEDGTYVNLLYGHDFTIIPRLDQMITEIEKRGYKVEIGNSEQWEIEEGCEKYRCFLLREGACRRFKIVFAIYDDIIDEATAQALLWIGY